MPKIALKPVTLAFDLPLFDVLNESATEWRSRAEAAFRVYCDEYIEQCKRVIEEKAASRCC